MKIAPAEDMAVLTPQTFAVFVDETGCEDYGDPKNPTFGRAGCGVVYADYQRLIAKPWRALKRFKLGGALKPFHASEFEQQKPTMNQIRAINYFLTKPFHRFAVMSDSRTQLPDDIDGHKAISLMSQHFVRSSVSKLDVDKVALFFEASERADQLVRRDFNLDNLNFVNARGITLEVDGYFMPKSSMEPGLELADLIAHTCGRQRRREIGGREGHNKDFQQVFWHSPIPPRFMNVTNVELRELALSTELATDEPDSAIAHS
jgi:hypothetical protein